MKRLSLHLLSIGLGLLFLYAGILKLADPAAFAEDISRYRMLPWFVSAALATWLPWVEITAAVSIALSRYRVAGALVLLTLMVIFTGALALAWARGLDIECGCFGALSTDGDGLGPGIIRNLLLLAGLILVATGRPASRPAQAAG